MSERADTARQLPTLPARAIGGVLLLVYPLLATPFFTLRIGAASLIEGTIALSLMFLAGLGGMVSLMQLSIAGLAGYMYALFGNPEGAHGFAQPWFLALAVAILIAVAFGTLAGALAVRTAGITTIMITLAVSVGFYYFCQQNWPIFNGYNGYAQVSPPPLFGIDWRQPVPFYYLCLGIAVLSYAAVAYVTRAPFGLALQAVRDNPRRLAAIGFGVTAHRIAAYAFASTIAAFAGILLVWFQTRISPGSVGLDQSLGVLVAAVLGGMSRPIGPFLGALAYILLENFAIDLIDPERFNTVIGLAFLLIVLFSPDGLLGLWARLRRALASLPRGGSLAFAAQPTPVQPATTIHTRGTTP
jgi:branched-chain amino acid transport system permease protein